MLGQDVINVTLMPSDFNVEWWEYRNRPRLTERVSDAIEERAGTVSAVAPVAYAVEPVRSGRRQLHNIFLRASTPALADVAGLDLQAGRFFTETDNRAARPVVVIGQTVAEELFPVGTPLGKHVRIGEQRFEVVGVLAEQGRFLGLFSFDEQVIIPLETYKKRFEAEPYLEVQAGIRSADLMDEAMDELTGIVRVARGLDPAEDDNFALSAQDSFRQQLAGVTGAIYGVGVFLTGLSLLVGGIGVMNIMFVSVKERTREIGIRKALGATQRAILTQFLVEAVVVCMIGGVIGIALSAGVTALINQVFTAYLSPFTVVLAFLICVGVGVAFGFIPAWTAARARPIEALGYE
jgi:putative ABC transport system permease protein